MANVLDDSLVAEGRTGRFLVVLEEGAFESGMRALADKAGIRTTDVRMLGATELVGGAVDEGSFSFEQIGVAVVDADPEQSPQIAALAEDAQSPVLHYEPERFVFAINQPASALNLEQPTNGGRAPAPFVGQPYEPEPTLTRPEPPAAPALPADAGQVAEFLRGYRAAVNSIADALSIPSRAEQTSALARELDAQAQLSAAWGLIATRVPQTAYNGHGIKLAVLDTGFDLHHPDFAGRRITSQSFVSGQAVQDAHGHGTHCVGVALGPQRPLSNVPRYGIAFGAEPFVGKVLDNSGRGTDGSILAGINWAVANKCAVVSMSLGGSTQLGEPYSQTYETTARRAAARGTLIIAAAGNESMRPQVIRPVGRPANCPSIVAVAAIDRSNVVASFSCAGLNPDGGEVNITGPGVDVFSAWPMPVRYKTISGTSMATPHAAGITALFAQASGRRGFDLANVMLRRARRLAPVRDFGWGMVQCP